jgi:glyoxylase-like metal-dependent hydrolase (beta-lactamase superfamily II)
MDRRDDRGDIEERCMSEVDVQAAEPGQAATAAYEVHAVRYGTLPSRKSELYYRYESYKEPDGPASLDYYFWVLRGGGSTILVDTGFDPAAAERRGRTCLVPPVEALAEAGVRPADVSTVVVTHLHYDHTGNLHAFPEAQLVVPARELEFWTGPYAGRPQFAPHAEAADVAYVRRAADEGRVRLTQGAEEIFDGVLAVSVGGHSPGQQVIVVESVAGPVVLTSDAVHLYEELELDRPFAVMHDLEQMYAAYDLVHDLARSRGAVVVPGHDPDVFLRHGGDATNGNRVAVRIA